MFEGGLIIFHCINFIACDNIEVRKIILELMPNTWISFFLFFEVVFLRFLWLNSGKILLAQGNKHIIRISNKNSNNFQTDLSTGFALTKYSKAKGTLWLRFFQHLFERKRSKPEYFFCIISFWEFRGKKKNILLFFQIKESNGVDLLESM